VAGKYSGTNELYRSLGRRLVTALLLRGLLFAQHPAQADPRPLPGVEFILRTFDRYQAVGIGDLPGCEEAHNFIRSLIRNPAFPSKVDDIVVDFGNPLMQPVVDRYLLEGELPPRGVLRRVWDDTTRSVDLTWDSPVYERFFDAIRSLNAGLPGGKKIHVVLADAPVDWTAVRRKDDLAPFIELRSRTLADTINAGMARGRRQLVIKLRRSAIAHRDTGQCAGSDRKGESREVLLNRRTRTVWRGRSLQSG